MPIYAYKCADCQHSLDVLQKVSDPPKVECPQCGRPSLVKQVTAAGFQLKGSGWYVTDFRDKAPRKEAADKADKADKTDTADKSDKSDKDGGATQPAEGKTSETKSTESKAEPTKSTARDSGSSSDSAPAAPKKTPPPPSGSD